ncbi:hypothetical protein HNQ54_000200 [Anaerocolumna cellulosilytica]|nr:hypothetical protein [Anaerocolumna cellulosilytica]
MGKNISEISEGRDKRSRTIYDGNKRIRDQFIYELAKNYY